MELSQQENRASDRDQINQAVQCLNHAINTNESFINQLYGPNREKCREQIVQCLSYLEKKCSLEELEKVLKLKKWEFVQTVEIAANMARNLETDDRPEYILKICKKKMKDYELIFRALLSEVNCRESEKEKTVTDGIEYSTLNEAVRIVNRCLCLMSCSKNEKANAKANEMNQDDDDIDMSDVEIISGVVLEDNSQRDHRNLVISPIGHGIDSVGTMPRRPTSCPSVPIPACVAAPKPNAFNATSRKPYIVAVHANGGFSWGGREKHDKNARWFTGKICKRNHEPIKKRASENSQHNGESERTAVRQPYDDDPMGECDIERWEIKHQCARKVLDLTDDPEVAAVEKLDTLKAVMRFL